MTASTFGPGASRALLVLISIGIGFFARDMLFEGNTPVLRPTGCPPVAVSLAHPVSDPASPVSGPAPDLPSPVLVTGGRCDAAAFPDFMTVLAVSHTDKGPSLSLSPTIHLYYTLYQKYFGPLRGQHVRMLEIGIGCDMRNVGASIPLWRAYLPCVHLTMFEYNGNCAENYRSKVDALVVGDQSSPADLARAVAIGPYHLIIDDGGHTMRQQITSLTVLFPTMPPGGIYVIEDMHTSVLPSCAVYRDSSQPGYTTYDFTSHVIRQLLSREEWASALPGTWAISRLALSVECFREACVYVRNDVKS